MPNAYDIAWRTVLAAAGPAGLFAPKLRRKVRKALRERSGDDVPHAPSDAGPCVMVHAVSLGEVNAARALVFQLASARSDLRFLVTVTTDTGHARAVELYARDPRVAVARYPLDLSPSIVRLLDRQRPNVVVLMELEVWPNFVHHCERRGIPVVLVNGRLTAPSFRNYRLGGPLVRRMFGRLTDVCAQDEAYAERFRALGARHETLRVTGTMKFDTAMHPDTAPVGLSDADGADLAGGVGLRVGEERIWVCGSTGPGEEEIVLTAYRQLLASHPALRLVVVPRHPERFDAVAALIADHGFPVVRRSASKGRLAAATAQTSQARGSQPGRPCRPAVVLGDTMGELRAFYALADVVFVGRSLVDLGPRQRGSDMIEPAALAKPVVVGPWTHNFADAVRQLVRADGIVEANGPVEVGAAVERLLSDRPAAAAMGRRARDLVRSQQGATARHVEVILRRLRS